MRRRSGAPRPLALAALVAGLAATGVRAEDGAATGPAGGLLAGTRLWGVAYYQALATDGAAGGSRDWNLAQEAGLSLNLRSAGGLEGLATVATVMLIFSLLAPAFFTVMNLSQGLKHLSQTAMVALGLTFVVAVGHSDMSFHFVSCFAGMTMSFFVGRGWSPVPSILLGLLCGLVFGLISGVAVGRFKLPDMIATIAIGSTGWGMAYLYSNGNYIYKNFLTSGIIGFSDWKLGGIPYPVFYMFAFYILGYILLQRTRHGRGFYATGNNKVAAAFSGVRVERYVIAAFATTEQPACLNTSPRMPTERILSFWRSSMLLIRFVGVEESFSRLHSAWQHHKAV